MTIHQKTKCRKGPNVERLDDEKTERVISINFYIYTVSLISLILAIVYVKMYMIIFLNIMKIWGGIGGILLKLYYRNKSYNTVNTTNNLYFCAN
jgi:hypothetical protein